MKVKDGIIGLVVGDALGVPVEFESRNIRQEDPVTDMREYGTYNQPRGTWSDDSSMTLATMRSITDKKGIDYEDIMHEFSEWYLNDKYCQYELFDIGNTTGASITRFIGGTPALECGGSGERDNGNGSLMRILPLAFIPNIDYETIENVSGLTHAHIISKISCVFYIEIARSMIMNELSIEEHVKNAGEKIKKHYKGEEALKQFYRIFENDFSEGVSGRGYVISTFESVIYCLENTRNYRDAVLKAVNLGDDTDTVAAICGGLAGIFYGFEDIPIDWIEQIPYIDRVMSLCEEYEEYCDGS